jgi:Leucine Rich repeat
LRGSVDDAAMHVLAGSGLDVVSLTLMLNSIRADGLAAVLGRARRLQTLLIGSNQLGNSLARVLETNAPTALSVLGVEATGLGDDGAVAIATGKVATTLTSFDLASNELTDEGAVQLAANATLPALRSLSVAYNRIGVRGERALRSRFEDVLRRAGGQLRV